MAIYRPRKEHRRHPTVRQTLTAAVERVFGTRAEDNAYPLGAFFTINVDSNTWTHVGRIWYVARDIQKIRQRVIQPDVLSRFASAIESGETVTLPTTVVHWESVPEDLARLLSAPSVVDLSAEEGARLLRAHIRRERKRWLRDLKIAAVLEASGTLGCQVCSFDFADNYGEPGEGFCEVHHTKPISERTSSERTELADLALLCSNCHSAIHRTYPMWTVEKLATEWATRHG